MQPDDTEQQTSTNISQKLSQLSMAKLDYSIYRVHNHLRNVNDKAYEPEIIAIGPYHRDKDNLIMMEEHKLRYLQLLLQRKNEHVKKFVSAVASLEQEARKCYAEPISLNATQFVEMMVLDGCFIIDLVRKYNMTFLREENDPIFQMDWILDSLQRDLMLFENQIPFLVVCKLFDLIEVPTQHSRLIHLFLNFFHNLYPGHRFTGRTQDKSGSLHDIKHLLGLIHSNWYPSVDLSKFQEDGANGRRKRWQFIDCATKLTEANVKFERNEGGTLFDVRFNDGSMLLSPLRIEDRTESLLRNMVAYEQYFQDTKFSFVTDYMMFLNCLIDSSRDVEILSRYRIIDNWVGDDEVVANMINKLTESVTGPGKRFIYDKIFHDVNLHCKKRRNRWMAKLRQNYLNSPWAIISILVAIVLLLLTLTQTVFSILQVV
ncbi:hypothetical protein Pfo_016320 [Paulownia fortunei]|nr:hypothetical protein Pfo_016320 [Paulownia fortunei]